jgi:hypothetical protein
MANSNTQRTLAYLRELGLIAEVVERWNPYSKSRHDLFNIIDIVALGTVIYGVQSCADSGRSEHRKKLLADVRSERWIDAGGVLWLVTWGKHKSDGKRLRWTPYVEPITKDMFKKEPV